METGSLNICHKLTVELEDHTVPLHSENQTEATTKTKLDDTPKSKISVITLNVNGLNMPIIERLFK